MLNMNSFFHLKLNCQLHLVNLIHIFYIVMIVSFCSYSESAFCIILNSVLCNLK